MCLLSGAGIISVLVGKDTRPCHSCVFFFFCLSCDQLEKFVRHCKIEIVKIEIESLLLGF